MKMKETSLRSSSLCFALLLLFLPSNASAQSMAGALSPRHPEIGRPAIRNYTPKEYGAVPQNWAIIQDRRGVMYFGNWNGVLEYDGATWRLISTPNKSGVRSFALDANGRIYVGAVGDLGYLAPDSLGQLQFVSLLDHVTQEGRGFNEVWYTYATSQGVYFGTDKMLLRWDGRRMRSWRASTLFSRLFMVRGRIFLRQWQVGLLEMIGDSLQLMPHGEKFAEERIYIMLPYDERSILIGTRALGLFLHDGKTLRQFETPLKKFLQANLLFQGAALPNRTFALATTRAGVAIMDQAGRGLQLFNRATGMQDETVNFAYVAEDHALWLALGHGITRIETASPFSLYGAQNGIRDFVAAVVRHEGRIYAATGLGVYYLQETAPKPRPDMLPEESVFLPVEGIRAQSWSMLSTREGLLVATPFGVYQIKGKSAAFAQESVSGGFAALTLRRSQHDSTRVLVGLFDGLATLRYDPHSREGWRNEGRVGEIHEPIWSIMETAKGELWLGTESQGLLRVKFSGNDFHRAQVERFDYRHGLPRGWVGVYAIAGRPVFTSDEGLYRYDEALHTFHRDSTFGDIFANASRDIEVVAEDHRGNVWLGSEEAAEINFAQRQASGAFAWMQMPSLRFPKTSIWAIYPEPNGITWFGGPEGVLRYDANAPTPRAQELTALIRRVRVEEEQTLFGGAALSLAESPRRAGAQKDERQTTLPHARNALRFEYSAPSFAAESENRFQTLLEGYEADWSEWTRETQKEYTNLFEGEYRFRVRARDLHGQVSREAVYGFEILPPWYRAWWAYAGYAVLLAAGVFGVDRLQRRRVLKKERERARMREAELRAQTAEAQAHVLRAEAERKEVELQKAAEIKSAYHALDEAHTNLKATQQQLLVQAKLASLGQLTAGIAHQIMNPLNFVNNFAVLSLESMKELREEIGKIEDGGSRIVDRENLSNLEEILAVLEQNAEKINQHGKRADGIVRSMMQHARGSSGQRELADVNQLLDDAVNLVYHGMKANDPSFEMTIAKEYDGAAGKLNVVPQDISRVFINLINNACYAAHQRKRNTPLKGGIEGMSHRERVLANESPLEGGRGVSSLDEYTLPFSPTLSVATKNLGDKIEIRIRDNGNGIPAEIREKIFNPFFTTKPTGQGTGLGLSISYDIIVQQHRGEIEFETEEGKFAEFVVRLPK